jgi:hypothetical protein
MATTRSAAVLEWVVVLDDGPPLEGVLAMLAERHEADCIADEVRKKGPSDSGTPVFCRSR